MSDKGVLEGDDGGRYPNYTVISLYITSHILHHYTRPVTGINAVWTQPLHGKALIPSELFVPSSKVKWIFRTVIPMYKTLILPVGLSPLNRHRNLKLET